MNKLGTLAALLPAAHTLDPAGYSPDWKIGPSDTPYIVHYIVHTKSETVCSHSFTGIGNLITPGPLGTGLESTSLPGLLLSCSLNRTKEEALGTRLDWNLIEESQLRCLTCIATNRLFCSQSS